MQDIPKAEPHVSSLGNCPPLRSGQVRMPEIDDQDDSLIAAVVPNLVVERVVEDQALTLVPFVLLVTDPNARAVRHDNPKVAPKPHVGRCVMTTDMAVTGQNRE